MAWDAILGIVMKKNWMIACYLLVLPLQAEEMEMICNQIIDPEEEILCQEECVEEVCCEEPLKRWGIEGRIAWYYPLSGETRQFYDSPIIGYQIEGMYQLCGRWQLFARVAYIEKKGKAELEIYGKDSMTHCPRLLVESFDTSLRMRIWQAVLGVQHEWMLPYSLSFSLGAGATYSWLWNKHGVEASHYSGYSWYSVGSKNKGTDHALGGVIKASLGFDFTRCVRAVLFIDYSATKFAEHDFDFSTIAGGVGLGVYF